VGRAAAAGASTGSSKLVPHGRHSAVTIAADPPTTRARSVAPQRGQRSSRAGSSGIDRVTALAVGRAESTKHTIREILTRPVGSLDDSVVGRVAWPLWAVLACAC